MKQQIVTIVPPPMPPVKDGRTQFVMTQGTKVLAEDGAEIRGITRIELIAESNDLWRAKIECLAMPPEITCLADVEYRQFDMATIAKAIFVSLNPGRSWDEHGYKAYFTAATAVCEAIRESQGIKP